MKFFQVLLFASLTASLSAGEWSASIQGKPLKSNMHESKGAHTFIHEKLDISAYKIKLNEKEHLVVRIRNGKHKMGGNPISLKSAETSASIEVGRIDIAKPMSIIRSKNDGAHLFETFMEKGKTYEIYYHIKSSKLEPKITVTTK